MPDISLDYVTEDDLRSLDLTPSPVPALCPWTAELRALNGGRCWATIDLAPLFQGGSL